MTDQERARFEILLEDLHSKISQIAEGNGVVVARTDRFEGGLTRLERSVEVLKTDVSVLKMDVSVLKTDVRELKTDMADIKPRVSRIEHYLKLNGDPRKMKTTKNSRKKKRT